MKVSERTLEILKNFASINNSVLIQEGNVFYTRTVTDKSLIAIATVADEFDSEMGIYDLTSLLQYMNLVQEPELEVSDNTLYISGNGTNIDYRLSDKDIIVCQENAPKVTEDPFLEVELPEDVLKNILMAKNIGVMKADVVEFSCKDGNTQVRVYNGENKMNVVSIDLEPTTQKADEFSMKFMVSSFAMIQQDYVVKLYERQISADASMFFAKFESEDVSYFVSAKAQSGCYVS